VGFSQRHHQQLRFICGESSAVVLRLIMKEEGKETTKARPKKVIMICV